MLFIAAGMGGGTGTGASPVIAKIAHELGILTVAVVTMPFRMEGPGRYASAVDGINELNKWVDSLLVIDNERLRQLYGKLPLKEAFGKADDVLGMATKGIAELITVSFALVRVDFADVERVMRGSGRAHMSVMRGIGENRSLEAAEGALSSSLLDDNHISGAKEILLSFAVSDIDLLTQDDVTIAIKDTVTGEVVEKDIPVNSEKPTAEKKEKAKNKKSEKADKLKAEELTDEIPDEELDALEGEDIGKSVDNEAQIVISFIKTVSEVKRGKTAEFAAEIEGSDAGVQWILRRSKNADGKVVSNISQDGVLTVSADETADKLVVIAAAAEDSTIRARWIVNVVQKSASSSSGAKTEEVTEIVVEETAPAAQPEAEVEEKVDEPVVEEEIVAEDEGVSDEILKKIEEELKMLEEQQSVLNFF